MMQGCIDYLLGDTKEAEYLRENCVFKIIPMLNIDGVIHGNYRCSLAGCDLNRRWKKPKKKLHPSVFALKEMIKNFSREREIKLIVDLHGHSRKMNTFFYGCSYKEDPVQTRVFPYMMSGLTENISFPECRFNVQKSKEKTARISLWKELRITNVFTMEASFYGKQKSSSKQHYTIRDLLDIGNSLIITLQRYLLEEEEERGSNKRGELWNTKQIILKNIKEREQRGYDKQLDGSDDEDGSDSNPSEDELSEEQIINILPKEFLTKKQKDALFLQEELRAKDKLKNKLQAKKQELNSGTELSAIDKKKVTNNLYRKNIMDNANNVISNKNSKNSSSGNNIINTNNNSSNNQQGNMVEVAVQTDASFIMEMKAYLQKRQSLQNGIGNSSVNMGSSYNRSSYYMLQSPNRLTLKPTNEQPPQLNQSANYPSNQLIIVPNSSVISNLRKGPSVASNVSKTDGTSSFLDKPSMRSQAEFPRYAPSNVKLKPTELGSPKSMISSPNDPFLQNANIVLATSKESSSVISYKESSKLLSSFKSPSNNSLMPNPNNGINNSMNGYMSINYAKGALGQNRNISVDSSSNNITQNIQKSNVNNSNKAKNSTQQPQQQQQQFQQSTPQVTNSTSTVPQESNLPILTFKSGTIQVPMTQTPSAAGYSLSSLASPKPDSNIFKKTQSQANVVLRNGKGLLTFTNGADLSSSTRKNKGQYG